MAKIFFKTYGCTLNQADSEIMKALLTKEGHTIVSNESEADVIVVNTCTVKSSTGNKTRFYLDKLKREGKNVVIAGCMNADKKLYKKYGFPAVTPGALRYITKAINDSLNKKVNFYEAYERKHYPIFFTPPIAKIPISEGCLNACFFCQTKFARRKLISQTPMWIVKWLIEALSASCCEIELTSTDTGAYGKDIKTDLPSLIKEILNNVKGNYRIRIGMINPHHAYNFMNQLLKLYKDERIYKFLHIPVQSGSNKVLELMNRGHTIEHYKKPVEAFKKQNTTIATDIIVGYPGETDEDFELTIKLLEETKPDIVNLSKFTPRPLTKAAKMKQLPSQVIKERSKYLSLLIDEISLKNNERFLGKYIEGIILEKGKGDSLKGRSNEYKQIIIKNDSLAKCTLIRGYVEEVSKTSLFIKEYEVIDKLPKFEVCKNAGGRI